MTDQEFKEIKSTFPWSTRVVRGAHIGGLVQVVDRHGREVPIFTMTNLLELLTTKMSKEKEQTE